MPIDAHQFARLLGKDSSFPFGIDSARAVSALRSLATEIEERRVELVGVEVNTYASPDEYGETRLRLTLHERREG